MFYILALLACVGIGFVAYGVMSLVKIDKSIARLEKKRELSKITTLQEIKATCKKIQNNDSTDYDSEQLLRELHATRNYLEKYF